MDDDFFDRRDNYNHEDGEIEWMETTPATNPMQKLESHSIQEQVDNLLFRLCSEVIPSAHPEDAADKQDNEANGDVDGSFELINSTVVHEMKRVPDMKHHVVIPRETPVPTLRMSNSAPPLQFEFPLDPFQQRAIQVIENEQSLLVAAHTSAGKTAIAKYAMAQSLANGKCCYYTSPIKSLSNQKYRDLESEFGNVGIMTGDVSINNKASIQVMTTEIMKSMLYKGADFSNVDWVIFDEIHYMNNEERGVVWEEVICMLPPHCKQLYLSATIPNALQFAGWLCSFKKLPIHVIATEKRPVALAHYILPVGTEKIFEIVNHAGAFREDKLAAAMYEMERAVEKKDRREKRRNIKDSTMVSLTRTLIERDLLSCIVFSFSRAECEHYATAIKDIDMNSEEDKSRVRGLFHNAIDLLTDEDKKLSQIENLLPLLERGIAVHHSGLLPIVKETIELLFSMGLLKMLFATETFAMGVNVPARTVVFTSMRKFDGKSNRLITASEYAQMSGRAGRRGNSYIGVCILMLDEKTGREQLSTIIQGNLDPLFSRFRLSYNMLLNLLDRREISPENMLEWSLRKYQSTIEAPEMQKKIALLESSLSSTSELPSSAMENVATYLELEKAITRIGLTTKKMYMSLKYLIPFLNAGRLVKIKHDTLDFGWGVVVGFQRKDDPEDRGARIYIVEVFIEIDASSARDFNNTGVMKPAGPEGKTAWEVVPMTVNCIDEIGIARMFVPEELKRDDQRDKFGKLIRDFVRTRMNGSPPLLDPITDLRVDNPALKEALEKKTSFEKQLSDHPLNRMKRGSDKEWNQFQMMTKAHREKAEKEKEIKQMKQELKRKKADIKIGTELFRKKEVLLKLGYIKDDETLKTKGKMAAQIATADEILLTELLVGGELEKVEDNAALAALLSCFVCDEQSAGKLSKQLTDHFKLIQRYASRVARMISQTGQEIVEAEYMDSFKPSLMEAVKQWVNGVGFGPLLKSTDLYEGSIIRCLRRLEELTKEMGAAARIGGFNQLESRFDDIRTAIKRDIVFAASLYL